MTLPAADRKRFWSSVETMEAPQARLSGVGKKKKATWIREGLMARVRHLRGEDKLRHATLQSLDVNKPISDDLGDRLGE